MCQKLFKARGIVFVFDLLRAVSGVEIILKFAAVINLIKRIRCLGVSVIAAVKFEDDGALCAFSHKTIAPGRLDLELEVAGGLEYDRAVVLVAGADHGDVQLALAGITLAA